MTRRRQRSEQISNGLMLVLIGAAAWAVQADYLGWREVLEYWPVLILIAGVEKLVSGQIMWGFFCLGLGGLLCHEEWRYFLLHDGWPLILIMIGIGITWEAIKPKYFARTQGDER